MTVDPSRIRKIAIISAMSETRVIGSGDGMPWDVPDEYQHFLDTTRGQTLIMGRKSFEIFGPTLTCKHCYVITRGGGPFDNAVAVGSLDEAIEKARQHQTNIFVAGGASIYALAIDLADEMLLSYIKGNFDGDAHFPEFSDADWNITVREDRGNYKFVHYSRL
jgi:dihydrofolate reductase